MPRHSSLAQCHQPNQGSQWLSIQELQESHNVGLVLFRQEHLLVADNGEEPSIMDHHLLQRLRGVVVEVEGRMANTPQRWDLEGIDIVEGEDLRLSRNECPSRVRATDH